MGVGAGIYFFTKGEMSKKKSKKSKVKASKKPAVTSMSFLVKTQHADEEGTQFEVDFEGSPSATEVRTTIEDDVLSPWLQPEFLNQGFRVYYKNDEGSFLMSNHTPFKTLKRANSIVVVINIERILPEQPDDEPEPVPKPKPKATNAVRPGATHELLPTGDDEEEEEEEV